MTTEIRFFALKSKKEKGTVMDRGQNGFNVKTTTQRVSRMYFRLNVSILIFIFPVQLTTSRIGNLTRLILFLYIGVTIK